MMMPNTVKASYGKQLIMRGIASEDVRGPADAQEAESKTFSYDNLDIDSPVGILATLITPQVTIFRANHSGGGYDCYLSLMFGVNSVGGWTNAGWVNPPGGLAVEVALLGNNGGYYGNYVFPSQTVLCGDRNKPVGLRQSIDPDLFPLTDSAAIWVMPRSWGRC